jgi:hypothetical protein
VDGNQNQVILEERLNLAHKMLQQRIALLAGHGTTIR